MTTLSGKHPGLPDALRTLKRRALGLGVAAAAGWSLIVAMSVWIAAIWLDLALELSSALRLLAGCAAVGLGVFLLTRLISAARRRSTPQSVARRLDETGATGGEVLSGVDLYLHPGSTPSAANAPGVTDGLARIAVERAAALVASIAPDRAFPVRPLVRPAAVLFAFTAGVVCLAVLLPRLAATQWLRFVDPFGDHPPYSAVTFSVEPGNFKVAYGQAQDIVATASGGAVQDVELVLEMNGSGAGEAVPMFPESGGRWKATITNIVSPGQYFVRARRSRSVRFAIDIFTVPRFEQVRFRVTPPEYTRRAAYNGPLPQGGLAGLPGTKIEVWARSNRPLSGGDMVVFTGKTPGAFSMNPVAAGGNEVAGSFEIRGAGKLEIQLSDTDGQKSTDKFTASVALLSDARPFIRMMEPRANSLATPSVSLPVRISAEDDYGVARVQLFRSLNDSRPRPLDLPLPQRPLTRFDHALELPLAGYGLRPGDVIKLFGRVEDNDPAGTKGSESAVVTVRIISDEEFRRMMMMRQGLEMLESKYQQAQRRVEALAEEIEKTRNELAKLSPESELAEKDRARLAELAKRMEEEAAAIRKAAEEPLPFDLDKALTPRLGELASKMENAAKLASEAVKEGAKAGDASRNLDEMAKQLRGGGAEFKEEATIPLDLLAKIYPLIEDQARFLELYAKQRDLAERLAALQGRDGEDDPRLKARMRDLEATQHKLREELDTLLDDIETHITQVPEDARFAQLRDTATEFVKAVRASPAGAQMADAEAGLAEFSGTRGHEKAKAAADTLEKFIDKCSGMGEKAGECLAFNPQLSAGLGDTIEQLLGAAGLSSGGAGMGEGGAGGYSARRSTLDNVGMYGSAPLTAQQRNGASGSGPWANPGASNAITTEPGADDSALKPGVSTAAGAEVHVPEQYRKRVGDYFQRVADELEPQEEK